MSPAPSGQRQRGGTAVVTGAGSPAGIGFASARALGLTGATVVLTSTTARVYERVEELRADGIRAFGTEADLVDPAQARRVVGFALERTGQVDVLVNNAGLSSVSGAVAAGALGDLTDADWVSSLACNLTTAFNITRASLATMVERRYGRIVNIASTSGVVSAFPADVGYHAAKAGMVGMTRSVAFDYARDGITCNAVAPGWIATDSTTASEVAAGEASPVGRPGTAAEVAHVVVALTAPEASYLTGQVIVVDGGNSVQEDHAAAGPRLNPSGQTPG